MFTKLKAQVQARFAELTASGQTLFYIAIDREKIFERYLAGWADDPVEQQGHNCNCCKSFLRQYGGIVTIVDNKVCSIWDIMPDELYAPAIKNVRDYVLSLPITDVFINPFGKIGTDKNVDSKDSNVVWNHFFIELPRQYVNRNADAIPALQGTFRDNKTVLKRSLDELTTDAVDTVLELIGQDSLYRGAESKGMLLEFQKLQREYKTIPAGLKDNYTWITSTKISQSLARFRNTAMGTLLIDLSKGVGLDEAVGAFERMMAPTNYKRPTALVTPRMIEDAKAKLTELGYLESLDRRFVQATDLNINNLLYIDKSSTLSNVFDDMKKDTEINPRIFSKTEEIGIDDFIKNVLPSTKALYVLLENAHLNNLVTTLTAVNSAPTLFKWSNPFSWAYTGGITDSIKERVKQAGGYVDGILRFSIQWNEDGRTICDLDAHAYEPNGTHIYYSSQYRKDRGNARTSGTGQLDVDMINPKGVGVENITWLDGNKMHEGVYRFGINAYSGVNNGFNAEIEFNGEKHEFSSRRFTGIKYIAEVTYSRTKGFSIKTLVESSSSIVSKEKWNLKTNRFHKVKNIMLSPNCWNGVDQGNKHHFFILENCASDEATRPFFNEFLKSELNDNRKFFELLAGKLVVSPTTHQVAGLGFSETQRNEMIVKVEGSFQRTLKVKF